MFRAFVSCTLTHAKTDEAVPAVHKRELADSRGYGMRSFLMACMFSAAAPCAWPAQAAAPSTQTKAAPVNITIRTAGDFADACTVRPTNETSFARLNFCNGFAQGTLQTNSQNGNGTRICIPSPSPKRSETMKEFASWVHADVSRKDEVASVAFLRFMAGRFRCT